MVSNKSVKIKDGLFPGSLNVLSAVVTVSTFVTRLMMTSAVSSVSTLF